MERSEILKLMSQLQLAGMRAAYDEIVTTGVKRSQGIERMIGALLQAEIAAKHARSINYQMGLAKFPLAKELADLLLEGSPINGALVESLASGDFLDTQRNVVLIAGTGTGKSHIAIADARSCIRRGLPAGSTKLCWTTASWSTRAPVASSSVIESSPLRPSSRASTRNFPPCVTARLIMPRMLIVMFWTLVLQCSI